MNMQRILNLCAKVTYKHAFHTLSRPRRALVSYVPTLPVFAGKYFGSAHNSRLKSYLICRTLNTLGYSVDLRQYDHRLNSTKAHYDLVIGHTSAFSALRQHVGRNGRSILLTTGSSPEFGNSAQRQRALELELRRGVRLDPFADNLVPSARDAHECADAVLMLGNDFVRRTWYPEHDHKYNLINNVSCARFRANTGSRGRNFLFLSSTGQVHRGLDLLLEVFASRSERLHICSAVYDEQSFVDAYHAELHETKNVITHGYVDLMSTRFREILEDCRYVILPSCSEGQSGSVINGMFAGLLPVVTRNVGLPCCSECGFLIEDLTLDAINDAVNAASGISEIEYSERLEALSSYTDLFRPPSFVESFAAFISSKVWE